MTRSWVPSDDQNHSGPTTTGNTRDDELSLDAAAHGSARAWLGAGAWTPAALRRAWMFPRMTLIVRVRYTKADHGMSLTRVSSARHTTLHDAVPTGVPVRTRPLRAARHRALRRSRGGDYFGARRPTAQVVTRCCALRVLHEPKGTCWNTVAVPSSPSTRACASGGGRPAQPAGAGRRIARRLGAPRWPGRHRLGKVRGRRHFPGACNTVFTVDISHGMPACSTFPP